MNEAIKWIVIFVVLTCLVEILTPIVKGKVGEKTIGYLLNKLDKEKYKVINDVLLVSEGGSTKTTQVDHMVVSVYGIFSIETKNYKGFIYGNEKSSQWTQNIHGHKYKFMNPLHQNYAHVKAIETTLNNNGYTDIPIYSIVTFPGDATLKVTVKNDHVVKWGALLKTIKYLSADECISKETVDQLTPLFTSKVTERKEMKEHVKDIKEVKKSNEEKVAAGICPKCGGKLVLRNGKRGKFYGCSNYPKCRYTAQV